jgi:hypothetical protein
MTLLEDLELAAQQQANVGGKEFAARLRAHAERLRAEWRACARSATGGRWAEFERADLSMLERINGGPLK